MTTTSKTNVFFSSFQNNDNNSKNTNSSNDTDSITDASNATMTQTADCRKEGKNKLLVRLTNTTRPKNSPPRVINDLLRAPFSDNASPECYIDEAIHIAKAKETKRAKRQSLRRKGSSMTERSVKELLHDNSDRLSSLLMQSRSRKEMAGDGFLSSDDESDLEDE
ncbi:unnamed protein product [Cylindrotheca closterium]|uniref:Uncharacterized protein n=1 Tax=Cylindrotheca closterium TaxID=2856 RepID=A0AAD2G1E2_9STRA|nr:unnamed protein product [Cylindrotheca closterium]